jgi:hypothetical protein
MAELKAQTIKSAPAEAGADIPANGYLNCSWPTDISADGEKGGRRKSRLGKECAMNKGSR